VGGLLVLGRGQLVGSVAGVRYLAFLNAGGDGRTGVVVAVLLHVELVLEILIIRKTFLLSLSFLCRFLVVTERLQDVYIVILRGSEILKDV